MKTSKAITTGGRLTGNGKQSQLAPHDEPIKDVDNDNIMLIFDDKYGDMETEPLGKEVLSYHGAQYAKTTSNG